MKGSKQGQERLNGFSIDIEANGFVFEASKIWTICIEDLDSDEKIKINPFKDKSSKDKIINWINKYDNPTITFHNGLGYDIFVLFFILGLEFNVGPDSIEGIPVQFVDTFYLSMFLNPDREKHSIEYWGNQVGFQKIDFRKELQDIGFLASDAPEGAEFMQYHELMDTYCQRDTLVGKLVFKSLVNEWNSIYKTHWNPEKQPEFYRAGQKAFYLMSCQELTGWKFDKEFGISLKARIEGMMEELRSEVEPLLPPRPLKKSEEKEYTMPAKPFKQNGEISATMVKWIEKHNAEYIEDTSEIIAYGKKYPIIAGSILDIKLPMSISNQDNMKDWFLLLGWSPTFYNFKKDSFGKPMRDPITRKLIPTTPKIQEAGKLCPNLENLEGDLVKKVVKWLSLRNRLAVLEGWLSNPRLDYDGRIGAGRTGIAATHRQKHKVLVNVPKASEKVLLGKEFRSLWISEENMLIAAGDAAALEGRVQAHYTWKYDDGKTARDLLEGDIHSKTAKSVYADQLAHIDITSHDFNKDDPFFKPFRDKSKNVFYACLPMNTKVLTLSGWKYFDEIKINDAVLSFNSDKGIVEEDKVLKKHFFKDKQVLKYSNKFDEFQCTEDHRWYGWRRSKTRNKPSKKVYGYFEMNQSTTEHNIILTAPWVGKETSNLTDDDCMFLGLMASDGYWKWTDLSEGTSSSFGSKKGIDANFSQSNNKFWREAEALFNRMGIEYFKNTYKLNTENPVNIYRIKSKWIRPYLDRVIPGRKNKHDVDWVSLVLSMTRSGLEAFYEGFYLGDGHVNINRYGEVISQNLGNIFDAVTTTAQLLGKGRVSFNRIKNSCSPMKAIRVQKRKHITLQEIESTNLGVQDAFCLTTKNGSFIIWQDDFIGITGNCLYGAGDSKLASTAGLPESRGKEVSDAFWLANSATAQLKEKLEGYWETTGKKKYLPAIDGRILLTRKKSALLNTIFQSCGGIVMDYAGLFMDKKLGGIKFDNLRRPYYLYKGKIVRRIGYFHDEYEYECEGREIAEEVAKMIEDSIAQAGKYLKLDVELAGEGKVGINWKETH